MNSDSDERARRLNIEAAKANALGRLTEEQALKLITINPAIQRAFRTKSASIEVGKDAGSAHLEWTSVQRLLRVDTTIIDGDISSIDNRTRSSRSEERAAPEQADPNKPSSQGRLQPLVRPRDMKTTICGKESGREQSAKTG